MNRTNEPNDSNHSTPPLHRESSNAPTEPADDLVGRLNALPAELDPERDLWPAIAARIAARGANDPARPPATEQSRPRPRALGSLALAASLVAALALGWSLHSRLEPAPVVVELPTPPTSHTPPIHASTRSGVETTAYAATGRELDAIRDELRKTIEARRDALPPETRRLVFDSLATIERAIGEIETALAAAPSDAELARTYIAYRQRQIDLLRQANRLAARL